MRCEQRELQAQREKKFRSSVKQPGGFRKGGRTSLTTLINIQLF